MAQLYDACTYIQLRAKPLRQCERLAITRMTLRGCEGFARQLSPNLRSLSLREGLKMKPLGGPGRVLQGSKFHVEFPIFLKLRETEVFSNHENQKNQKVSRVT